MAETIKVAEIADLPAGSRKVCTVGRERVVVFNVNGQFYAIDNQCPHRGAQLGEGSLDELVIQCPWHGWRFDLTTGVCLSKAGRSIRCHEVRVECGDVLLSPKAPEETELLSQWSYQYLVRYSMMGYLDRFGSTEQVDCLRGSRVVVRTQTGLQVGEVLVGPSDEVSPEEPPSGELVRLLSPEDEQRTQSLRDEHQQVYEACQRRVMEQRLPLDVIDFEPLVDGDKVILYFLGEPSAELGRLATELGQAYRTNVEFQPAIEPARTGCGSGCHNEGGAACCGSGQAE